MALFGRRERPPAELVAAVGPDDRIVSWADTEDSTVAASRRGVWWPDGSGHELIAWNLVNKVRWDDGVLALTPAEVVDDVLLVDQPERTVRLTEPRNLPPELRTRVEGNITRNELVRVGGGSVRFVARRVPGVDGAVWWARLEPGTPDTEATREAVRARVVRLREQGDR